MQSQPENADLPKQLVVDYNEHKWFIFHKYMLRF